MGVGVIELGISDVGQKSALRFMKRLDKQHKGKWDFDPYRTL
jgi:hypothetical protein